MSHEGSSTDPGTRQVPDSIAPAPEEQFDRVPPSTPVAVGAGTPDDLRRYAVYRGLILIGTTNLEVVIDPGVRAAGIFYPTSEFRAVRSVFALYRRAADRSDKQLLREFVRRRDRLDLHVWRAGVELDAKVELISAWDAATHVVHITSHDDRLWCWRYPDT